MKKILYVIVCSAMILSLTGCKDNPKLEGSNTVLVKFEDEKLNIKVKDLYDILKKEYGINYLVEIIDEKILNSIYETDDIANKFLDDQIETYTTYYGGEKKFLEALQSSGIGSIEEFRKNLLLGYKRELAVKDYIKKNLKDNEIKKYYENEIFGDITASHILISLNVNNTMTDEEKRTAEEAAKTKVNEVLQKLQDGKDFHEIAKEYSEDKASSANGGRLDSFNKGEMSSSFEKAAMNLKVGEYTKSAIQTEYGYHIIYKEDEKDKPKMQDVKETIINNLIDKKLNDDKKLQYKALIDLRKEYGIEINDEDLNSYYDNAVNNWLYGED